MNLRDRPTESDVSRYLRPRTLHDAVDALSGGDWTIVAGGTDHYPARVTSTPAEDLLDVTAIADLQGIDLGPEGLRIGAATSWTRITQADLPAACDGLKSAAREVGGLQVQNRGTLGGNLCNASPAADGIPPLLSLDAQVELASAKGSRRLPLEAFVLGNRKTALAPDELLTAIHIPRSALDGSGQFLKLGARHYLVISIVMVAGTMARRPDGTITALRLAVGACSTAAIRLRSVEHALIGGRVEDAGGVLADDWPDLLDPIDDVRADRGYRIDAARTLVQRCVTALGAAA